jgi:hypothetical protein
MKSSTARLIFMMRTASGLIRTRQPSDVTWNSRLRAGTPRSNAVRPAHPAHMHCEQASAAVDMLPSQQAAGKGAYLGPQTGTTGACRHVSCCHDEHDLQEDGGVPRSSSGRRGFSRTS